MNMEKFTDEVAFRPYYSAPLAPPASKRQGLCNAVQIIINCVEAGNTREGLLQAVNLLNDVTSKSNPYRLAGLNS